MQAATTSPLTRKTPECPAGSFSLATAPTLLLWTRAGCGRPLNRSVSEVPCLSCSSVCSACPCQLWMASSPAVRGMTGQQLVMSILRAQLDLTGRSLAGSRFTANNEQTASTAMPLIGPAATLLLWFGSLLPLTISSGQH